MEKAGKAVALRILLNFLCEPLLSVPLTLHAPAGQRIITLSPGAEIITALLSDRLHHGHHTSSARSQCGSGGKSAIRLTGRFYDHLRVDMFALRKLKSKGLAATIGITEQNLVLLKQGKVKGICFSTLNAPCVMLDCQPGNLLEYVTDEPQQRPGGKQSLQTNSGHSLNKHPGL